MQPPAMYEHNPSKYTLQTNQAWGALADFLENLKYLYFLVTTSFVTVTDCVDADFLL